MRYCFFLCVLAFVSSCSTKEIANQPMNIDTVKVVSLPIDTTFSDTLVQTLQTPWTPADSAFFVGYANYFPTTKEFYVSLYATTDSAFNEARANLDSMIFNEDEVVRQRLSLELGKKYFYLHGMDTVMLCNRSHQIIAKTVLSHIEYFADMISGEFVAVYKYDQPVKNEDGPWYCMSASYKQPIDKNFSSNVVVDKDLNARIAKRLKSDTTKTWTIQHVRIMPTGKILTTASLDTMSYVLETAEGKIRILNQERNNFHFGNFLPLPFMINDKPLLLMSYSTPGSDVVGDLLFSYNGKTYEPVELNRMGINTIPRNSLATDMQ
jgi:hypothetical protein